MKQLYRIRYSLSDPKDPRAEEELFLVEPPSASQQKLMRIVCQVFNLNLASFEPEDEEDASKHRRVANTVIAQLAQIAGCSKPIYLYAAPNSTWITCSTIEVDA